MALTAIGVGVLFGFLLGWARVSRFRSLRAAARGYIELIRGTPLLVQLFLVFFSVPAMNIAFRDAGIPLSLDLSPLNRVIIALLINTSAYQGEIFRAGFQSIASGQIDAATSLGMTRLQTMAHVILPQTLRTMAPPLTNEYIIMFKEAAPLAFVFAVPELLFVTRRWGQQTQLVLESFLLLAAVFLALSLLLTLFLRLLERRLSVPGLGIAVRTGAH